MNKRQIIPYHKLPKRLIVLPKEEAISDTVSTRDYSDLFVYFRFAIIPFYVTTFVSIIIFYYYSGIIYKLVQYEDYRS